MSLLPEIEHTFNPPDPRPSPLFSVVFTGAIAFVFLVFLIFLYKLNMNSALFAKVRLSSSMLFFVSFIQGMLLLILGLYINFWVWGNLISLVQQLLVLILPFLLIIQRYFSEHSEIRAKS
mmetsp:Transcript_11972/g.1806  ORF Transcript_11972/g.1806 Transcript_11972/m.1806 type:complete len:120 (+) Transcript_11972:54-413(+)